MRPQKSEDHIRHEAGHLVAAKILNFETGKIVLRASQAEAEIILQPRFPDILTAIEFMRRRIQVLYAGALAQSLENGKAVPKNANAFLDSTAVNDHSKARELVRFVVAMEYPEASDDVFAAKLTEVGEALYTAALNIIEQQSPVIEEVVEAFMRAKRTAKNPHVFELAKEIVNELPGIKLLIRNAER
jgi:hypothetical protein